jgi:hypothetical protein
MINGALLTIAVARNHLQGDPIPGTDACNRSPVTLRRVSSSTLTLLTALGVIAVVRGRRAHRDQYLQKWPKIRRLQVSVSEHSSP